MDKWHKLSIGTAAIAIILAILSAVWNDGGAQAHMQTEIDSLKAQVAAKEDASAAREDRIGEMDEIKALEAQEEQIITLIMDGKK